RRSSAARCEALGCLAGTESAPVFGDQGLYLGRLKPVVLLVMMRHFGKPFPPEHSREEGMVLWQFERDFDAALLDFGGVIPPGLESPGLGRSPRTFVVTNLNEKKLLSVLAREFVELGALPLPRCRNFRGAGVG